MKVKAALITNLLPQARVGRYVVFGRCYSDGLALIRKETAPHGPTQNYTEKAAENSQPTEELMHELAFNNVFPIALNKATTPTNFVPAGAAGAAAPDCSLLHTSYYTTREVAQSMYLSSLSMDANYKLIN